tara:strand:+ start:48 stop:563 length:516 start_codon:yes stop_codon:yes gene_type:complete
MKFLAIFLYLISTTLSYSIEKPNIKNIVINKDPKSYKNVVFKDLNDVEINLENFKNKLLIINFWATWCAPCKKEMPSLDLLKANKTLNNLQIFPINVGREDLKKTTNFFSELNIKNLKIYYSDSNELPNKFSLVGLPTTILIDKNGLEFARIIGTIDFNDQEFINWLKNYN